MFEYKENCFWLDKIRGQGATEYYCDYYWNCEPKCKDCGNFIHNDDVRELVRVVVNCLERLR